MDKRNRDHKRTKKDNKKPVNKNPQINPEKDSDNKAKSKKA